MRRYKNYKESGIDWIGEIPEHWEVKRLKYLISANDGGVWGNDNGQQYVLRSTEINIDGSWNYENEPAKRDLTEVEYNKSRLFEGDLLITKSSGSELHIGKTAIVNQKIAELNCCFSNFMQRIRVKENCNSDLFFYLLNSFIARTQYNYLSNTTTGLANLSSEILSNILFPVPPANEQIAIANYLDKKTAEIDELIKQKEELLLLFEEEKKAVINNAVTKGLNPDLKSKDSGIEWLGRIPEHWEVKKLKYVAGINPTKDNSIDKESSDLVVFLPMERVKETGEFYCNLKRSIQELWNGFTFFRKNDIIIAKITPCFENGKGALLENLETEFGFGSTEFHVLRANGKINSKYLYYLTRSELFMKIGEAFMTGAAGQKRVPTDFISEFKFPIPQKTEEQESIVEFIVTETSRINTKLENTKKLIEQLKEYKTALISEVSTGKIKVI